MSVDRKAVRLVCSLELWRMAVYWTLSLFYYHLCLFAVQRLAALFPSLVRPPPYYPRRRFAPSPEIERPICVITGASSGLGAAAAKVLAKEGYHVILAGRSPLLLNKDVGDKLHRGICFDQPYATTTQKQSWDFQDSQFGLEDFRNETLAAEIRHGLWSLKNYPFGHTYEYSKLCLLLFSYQLHQQLYVMDPAFSVSVMPADPGFVRTNIMRELPPSLSWLALTVLGFLRLLSYPEEGVDAIIDAALAPPEASGKYFFGGKGRTMKSSSLSYNVKLAEELWANSLDLFQEIQNKIQEARNFTA